MRIKNKQSLNSSQTAVTASVLATFQAMSNNILHDISKNTLVLMLMIQDFASAEIVSDLLNAGANEHSRDAVGNTALMFCAGNQ